MSYLFTHIYTHTVILGSAKTAWDKTLPLLFFNLGQCSALARDHSTAPAESSSLSRPRFPSAAMHRELLQNLRMDDTELASARLANRVSSIECLFPDVV
ncbi:unnamed protein product [Periconia digitata]|uniref:Uncharacterized protein n=1 Tax=Periconia digitata TaxID=1303443 RepID=A0A9W4TZJ3_9PLEO|nr:unnamed protein product [Periconia digitata]